jgi:hypothetical protein
MIAHRMAGIGEPIAAGSAGGGRKPGQNRYRKGSGGQADKPRGLGELPGFQVRNSH